MNDQEENLKDAHLQASSESTEELLSAQVNPKKIVITDEELRNIQHELMDYKDKYLRLLADADNARKRLQKERQDLMRNAVEHLAVDILRPLDNLENALQFAQSMSDEVKHWALGFQMILTQFKDALSSNGVVAIDSSKGKEFDPAVHEAIETEEGTEPHGIIIEQYTRGYRIGDRIIRPARVKVSIVKQNGQPTAETSVE